MQHKPFVTQVNVYDFTVQDEAPLINHPIGEFCVQERAMGDSNEEVEAAVPAYGFQLFDVAGNKIAEVAPGYWPMLRDLVGGFLATYGAVDGFRAAWAPFGSLILVPTGKE